MKHVHFVSPAGAIDLQLLDAAIERLRSWGYKVTEGEHTRSRYGGFAGTDDERIDDLNRAFADPDIDVIICSRGGYGMCRIIDRVELDPDHIPLVVGYSDITCLHNLMGAVGERSLHAIMAKQIATLPEDSEPIVALRKLIEGEEVTYNVAPHEFNRTGVAEGILRGGNMQVGYGLRGTAFDIVDDGNTILFIEDVWESAHALDRIMWSLRMSGILERLQGLIVGRFADCREEPDLKATLYELIRDVVADYDYPVAFNFPAGHIDHNLPLALNAPCRLAVSHEQTLLTM
ncbi:MAG: LD-carboxypeptidase [Paludibacteraceae bacterium]|nr:LD-carboxypeptidase [Paludibacteraceae bacterium]